MEKTRSLEDELNEISEKISVPSLESGRSDSSLSNESVSDILELENPASKDVLIETESPPVELERTPSAKFGESMKKLFSMSPRSRERMKSRRSSMSPQESEDMLRRNIFKRSADAVGTITVSASTPMDSNLQNSEQSSAKHHSQGQLRRRSNSLSIYESESAEFYQPVFKSADDIIEIERDRVKITKGRAEASSLVERLEDVERLATEGINILTSKGEGIICFWLGDLEEGKVYFLEDGISILRSSPNSIMVDGRMMLHICSKETVATLMAHPPSPFGDFFVPEFVDATQKASPLCSMIPESVWLLILSLLDAYDLLSSCTVCKYFNYLCSHRLLWDRHLKVLSPHANYGDCLEKDYRKQKDERGIGGGSRRSKKLYLSRLKEQKINGKFYFGSALSEIDNMVKICLLGGINTGKSVLCKQFGKGKFINKYRKSISVEFVRKRKVSSGYIFSGGILTQVQIWDRSGDDEFPQLMRHFFRGLHAIVVLYSIVDEASFKDAKRIWLPQAIETLKESKYSVKNTLWFVGTKVDLENERQVSWESGENLAKEVTANYREISLKSRSAVLHLANEILSSMK